MSHSSNITCCFPYLSFKKQASSVQASDKNKSAMGLSNDAQNIKKIKRAELLQSVGGVQDQIKSNKVVPQIQIYVNDSPSFHDQTAIVSTMQKGQYSDSPSPCASSGYSSMSGSPMKRFKNFKYVQNYEEDSLKIISKTQSKQKCKINAQKQINKQKPQKSQFFKNQQEINFVDQSMENFTSVSQNNQKPQIVKQLTRQQNNQQNQEIQTRHLPIMQQQFISQGHSQLEDIDLNKQNLKNNNNQLSNFHTSKIQQIPLSEVNKSMIKNETEEIIDSIFMDFNLLKFQNKLMIIDPSHLDEQLEGTEDLEILQDDDDYSSNSSSSLQSSVSSKSSSCNSKSISNSSIDISSLYDQNFQGGKINLENLLHYSIFMNDQSASRNHNNDSSMCRFGSVKQFEAYQQSISNTDCLIEQMAKLPQVVSPQISQRHIKQDVDQVIQRSPILKEKFSQSNQLVKLEEVECLQNLNNIQQQISEASVKLPYFQTLSGKQSFLNLQSSKKSTEVSHLNSSLVQENLININEEELLSESISSMDWKEELQ
eukprot:403335276